MIVCVNPNDPYLVEHDIARWAATLSNSEQVWQDDNRPGLDEPIAWLRLKAYIKKKNLRIVSIHLKFRSHIVPLLSSESGYYMGKGIGGFVGGKNKDYYVYGYVRSSQLIREWWYSPELVKNKLLGDSKPLAEFIDHPNYIA